jgi:hypothetical protein
MKAAGWSKCMENCQVHRYDEVLDDHNAQDIGNRFGIIGFCGGWVQPIDQAGISVGIMTENRVPCCFQHRIPVKALRFKDSAINKEDPPIRHSVRSDSVNGRVGVSRPARLSSNSLLTLRVWQWLPGAADSRQAQHRDLCPCRQWSLCRLTWSGSGDKRSLRNFQPFPAQVVLIRRHMSMPCPLRKCSSSCFLPWKQPVFQQASLTAFRARIS